MFGLVPTVLAGSLEGHLPARITYTFLLEYLVLIGKSAVSSGTTLAIVVILNILVFHDAVN